ncbi:MAG: glycyl-radical enzyme activating protein [Oscillospiraceae bacterium]|nr:glycyl-radical enzyme activating protein [Oscillospiraceae bacterium]
MASGTIFNIQRYSIHDGCGIRTILFLKGCPLHCPWCSNPESQSSAPEITFAKDKCIGCGYCVKECGTGALALDQGRISLRRDLCSKCGKCTGACYAHALEMAGQTITVEEAFEEIEKDALFYKASKGGVTLSGGEPLMQIDFATALLKKCKENGIDTAIETTGYQKWEDIEKIAPYIDTFLYDIKLFDGEKHRRITGVHNDLILENAAKITAIGKTLVVRVPVIPGVNDDLENLRATVRFAASIRAAGVNLLPYHRLGENKYGLLGRTYALKGLLPPETNKMRELLAELSDVKIPVSIGG